MQDREPPSSGKAALHQWPEGLIDEYGEGFNDLTGIALAMLGSRAEAEEVVQEAFMATARRWESVDKVRPYLRRAVVNGAVSVLRRRGSARRAMPDPPPVDASPPLIEFRDLLLALPIRQRTVLVLRYLEDLPDAEIADIVECRPATVRSLAARGLATIRKDLT